MERGTGDISDTLSFKIYGIYAYHVSIMVRECTDVDEMRNLSTFLMNSRHAVRDNSEVLEFQLQVLEDVVDEVLENMIDPPKTKRTLPRARKAWAR